ncbi:MAG: repeat-containing protein [Verrucomicrobiaceae bacterium]|nr:repeat-containing protein [Verrucomicrobiaceae bacterium]
MSSHFPSVPAPANPRPAWLIELGWGERYELIEIIGRGGMGQVWKGRDVSRQEVVALKVLDPSRTGDDHMLARLEKEADTLKKLLAAGRHRHIVAVLDFAINETNACMVMAFIPGLDLRAWCEAHRLDLRARVDFMEKVARAAGWCHQNGVVHRDLKPANILVHAVTREPVIVDFSIAKSLGQLPLTLTGEALGTVPYMAPEQLDDTWGEVTPASDVYALGATLYELLTHVHPHPGSRAQITERHRNEIRPARPSLLDPGVPRDLDSICLKALALRPGERYADGTQLADDLASFLAGGPVKARPASTVGYLARQARRRPYLSSSLAGCFVLGICLLLGLWQARRLKRMDDLKQSAATLASGRSWSPEALEQMERAVDKLAVLDPALAKQERDKWRDDVKGDVLMALQRPRLVEGDTVWIPAAIRWMGATDPAAAAHLDSLYHDRLERWEPYAEVRPPFDDWGRLFPHRDVHKDLDALLPLRAPGGPEIPLVMVKQPMESPCEVTALFTPPADRPLFVAMVFEFNQVRTRVVLASAGGLPAETRKLINGAIQNDECCVLYMERQGKMVQSMVVPDASLAHRRFSMQVRVEPDHVRCQVEELWSLRLDEEFIIPQASPQNSFKLSWPVDLRLQSLVIKNHAEKRLNSPLEQGDILAAQGRWPEARRKFEAHTGDVSSGQEATWKAAYAAYQEGQVAEALAGWQSMVDHPDSSWRALALYELWRHHALHAGVAQAAPFLKAIQPEHLEGGAFRSHVTSTDRKLLTARYARATGGVNIMHPDTAILDQAAKAFALLEMPEATIARHLGLARHLSGLDEAARDLWTGALNEQGGRQGQSQRPDQDSAWECLDAWCRVDSSENQRRLAAWIALWRKTGGGGVSMEAVVGMEEARKKARAGQHLAAMNQVQALLKQGGMDPWLLVRARLLEGMLQREQGREAAAQVTWRKGLQTALGGHRAGAFINLCDVFALRMLSASWEGDSPSALILELVDRSCGGQGLEFQGVLTSTLLADPEFAASLARLAQEDAGRRLLSDYVLVKESARLTLKRAAALVLQQYFVSSAFLPAAAAANTERVKTTVQSLFTAAATGKLNGASFGSYLQAWNTPDKSSLALPPVRSPAPDPLRAQLCWLLGERYLVQGHAAAARPLLLAARQDPSLPAGWGERIGAVLESQEAP